jgi:hypothetical protein
MPSFFEISSNDFENVTEWLEAFLILSIWESEASSFLVFKKNFFQRDNLAWEEMVSMKISQSSAKAEKEQLS